MLVQAEQHSTITATNQDQVLSRQHSQDSTIFHLSSAMNQIGHAQAIANFSPMPDGKKVRLQRLQMLQKSHKKEATSSKDPRSRAYAKLYERTVNPELRSRNFLEIPAARKGLVGGYRNDRRTYEIEQKRGEIAETIERIDNLRTDLNQAVSARRHAADEVEANQLAGTIENIRDSILSEQMNLSRLQEELSCLISND